MSRQHEVRVVHVTQQTVLIRQISKQAENKSRSCQWWTSTPSSGLNRQWELWQRCRTTTIEMERPAESQRNQDELASNGATEALSQRMMQVGSTQKATRAGTTNAKPTSIAARQTDAVPRGSTPQTPADHTNGTQQKSQRQTPCVPDVLVQRVRRSHGRYRSRPAGAWLPLRSTGRLKAGSGAGTRDPPVNGRTTTRLMSGSELPTDRGRGDAAAATSAPLRAGTPRQLRGVGRRLHTRRPRVSCGGHTGTGGLLILVDVLRAPAKVFPPVLLCTPQRHCALYEHPIKQRGNNIPENKITLSFDCGWVDGCALLFRRG